MPSHLSETDLDAFASLTVKDASMGVVLTMSVVVMILPFLLLVLTLLPRRGHRARRGLDEGKV